MISYCSNGAFEDASKCSEYLDSERLTAGLEESCIGKSSCSVSNLKSLLLRDKPGFNAAECDNAESHMFIQLACIIDHESYGNAQEVGLIICCLAVFVAMFVINYIDYVQKLEENSYVEWDVKTITAGDYAVEFDIDEEFYNDYMKHVHDEWFEKTNEKRQYKSRVQAFQAWIQNEMELKISELPDMGYEEG